MRVRFSSVLKNVNGWTLALTINPNALALLALELTDAK
ncbi:unnamed protein product, partial [Rotaria sp. Silwood2]